MDSDDDSALVAAAEAWGEQQTNFESSSEKKGRKKKKRKASKQDERQEEPSPKKSIKRKRHQDPTSSSSADNSETVTSDNSKPQSLSVHVTQLDFNTTEWDLRQHFVEKGGCLLTSVRLVFDKGLSGNKQFRGVAFVDCSDKESYGSALKLHHSRLLDRRINVRPTLSKAELVNVVQGTQEKVRQTIHKFWQEKKDKAEDETDKNSSATTTKQNNTNKKTKTKSTAPSKTDKREKKYHNEQKSRDKVKKSHSNRDKKKLASTPKKPEVHKKTKESAKHGIKSPDKKKLTKKERNRRAAIIRGKR